MGKIIHGSDTVGVFNYTHGDTLITKTITENDTYNAVDDGADGYSSVTVSVSEPTLISKSCTDNGTYVAVDDNADGYSSVSVNVPLAMPTFTQTTIATGTTDGVVTFTDDYNNYDFVLVRCINTSSLLQTDVLVTPTTLNACFGIDGGTGRIVFNQIVTNVYGTYYKSASDTWTRTGQRTFYVASVIGIDCTNYTVTETEIYNKGSYDTTAREITGTDFLSYDMYMVVGSNDGLIPNVVPVTKGFVGGADRAVNGIVTLYNGITHIQITDTKFTSAKYHYIGGIKFTSL